MSRQGDHLAEHSVRFSSSLLQAYTVFIKHALYWRQDMDDLRQLLDHVHSGSVEKKRKAAEDLPLYIQKVPEMQDDVVNAVYDLCEDTSAEVSISRQFFHV
jgi:uncharacterized protein YaaR (DUF327 family)